MENINIEAYNVSPPCGQSESTEQRPVRVLVVDDDPQTVQLLTMALGYEGFEVTVARNSREAMLKASTTKPDLLILDWLMPDMDGIEMTRKLRAAGDVGILMLTAYSDDEDQVLGLESGADGYIIKPFTVPVLLARIRAILRRKGINFQSTIRAGDVMVDRLTRRVARGGRQIELTPREFDLLEMLVLHPRHVFTREAILNRVWGYDYYGETNLVDVYIRYLRDKLGDSERTLIRSVRGIGYALDASSTGVPVAQGCQDERV